MIVLTSRKNANFELFDHVWCCNITCVGMPMECEHHPELAADKDDGAYCIPGNPLYDEEEYYRRYVAKMKSEPTFSKWKEVVKRSDNGEWFQLLFYEDLPSEGERPHLYKILKELTSNIKLE